MISLLPEALDQLVSVGLLSNADVIEWQGEGVECLDDATRLRTVLTQLAGRMHFAADLDGLAVQARTRGMPQHRLADRWGRWFPVHDILKVPSGYVPLFEGAMIGIERRIGMAPTLRLRLRDAIGLDVIVVEGEEHAAEFAGKVVAEAWRRSMERCEVCGMPGRPIQLGLRRTVACQVHVDALQTLPLPPPERASSGEVAAVLAGLVADDPVDFGAIGIGDALSSARVSIRDWTILFGCSGGYPVDTISARAPDGRTGTLERWVGLEAGDPLHLLGALRESVAIRLHDEIVKGDAE